MLWFLTQKTMSRAFIFLLIFLELQSCSFIAKRGYGAKQPQIETEQSIIIWLNKYNLPIDEVVTVDTTGFNNFFPSLAQAPLLFEKTGKFRAAGFSNGKYCPQGVDIYLSRVDPRQNMSNKLDSFIISETITISPEEVKKVGSLNNVKLDELKKIATNKRDTIKMNFHDINRLFYSLNGNKRGKIEVADYDFVLILPFAKFYGSNLQIKDLKKYYHSAMNNANAKFKIIFLNLDKQFWWGKETNDRINISI
jgi:hypothetical protein